VADGRDLKVWDTHAQECRESGREPFKFTLDDSVGGWLRSAVVRLMHSGAGTAIDIGCGPGYWRNLFEGLDYLGIDQSQDMLALAREVSPVGDFSLCNARQLSLSRVEKYDIAFTSSVLQHNRNTPDKKEIVDSVYKLLTPGGHFLCTENTFHKHNCPHTLRDDFYTDGYSFTPKGWERFMLSSGFKLISFNGKSEYLYQKV
jgi:ubiquinone/menaquinone biosynthesis C-methylase UbiE